MLLLSLGIFVTGLIQAKKYIAIIGITNFLIYLSAVWALRGFSEIRQTKKGRTYENRNNFTSLEACTT